MIIGKYSTDLYFSINFRRKVSDKVMEVAQYIGLVLILALLIFANGNDIYKFFK